MSSLQDILAGLQKTYLASMPEKVVNIGNLWKAQDLPKLETEYHKLKGTGRTYGLPEFTQLGETLEKICMRNPSALGEAVPLSLTLLTRMRDARVQNSQIHLDNEPDYHQLLKMIEPAGRP